MGLWCEFDGKRVLLRDITAGTTLSDTIYLPDYSSAVWQLSIALRGPTAIDLTAVANDDGSFGLAASSDVTASWAAGRYWYSARVSNGGAVFEVGVGETQISTNLSTVSGSYDGRSTAEIALDAIDAVLANRASRDQERYRINNRELVRTPIKDLISLRAYYSTLVSRERAKKSGRNRFGRAIPVRFGC